MKKIVMVSVFSFVTAMATFASAATIKGVVKYDGEAPKFKEIKMDADPVCLTHNKEAVFPQTLVLGEGNTMAHVFAHVVSGLPQTKYPTPTQEAVLDQKGCMYEPHVLGVMVGQTVKILNPDGTLHNVHALSKNNPEFNLAMPKFRTETTKVFDKTEFMFPMKCDVHPWMTAYIAVMEHPFFSVTKTDGVFTIDNLPAGTYEIETWHEKLGKQKQSVTLADGETKEITVTYTKPAKN